jgi:hypothetical protein
MKKIIAEIRSIYCMNNDKSRSVRQTNIINTIRDLWRDYFIWITDYLINIICGFGNTSYITGRIKEELQKFVTAFEKYYGYENAFKFESFLNNYLIYAADLFNTIKSGNTEKINTSRTELYKNADDIAEFFITINPNWNKQEWQNLIYEHLRLIENEFIYRIKNGCTTDMTTEENIGKQILKISDYMAEGIIKQFNI